MSLVKQIDVKTIIAPRANAFVKRHHYSGKVVPNSQLHFGAFLNGELHGVLSFGPSMQKTATIKLVANTGWNEFIELNRMAFDDTLPKNSESRVIGICLRILKKQAPQLKWLISFADATRSGDGAIYRATGFILTGIKRNSGIVQLPDGRIGARMTYTKGKHIMDSNGRANLPEGTKALVGFQLRYIYFFDKSSRQNLVPSQLPFSAIAAAGASMYKGMRRQDSSNPAGFHSAEGGVIPTPAHQEFIIV